MAGRAQSLAESDLQATFAINITGLENDVGSGLHLPESVIINVGRLLNNPYNRSGGNEQSHVVSNTSANIGHALDTALRAGPSIGSDLAF